MNELDPISRQRIEEGLANWDDPTSEARMRFGALKEEWDTKLRPLFDAIETSERITDRDLRIVINMR